MQQYIGSIEQKFDAMIDSVNIIQSLVAANVKSMSVFDQLDRNYRHLEIMLSKDEIIQDGRDLAFFQDAIALGRAFTGFAKV
jgi:hypothetical protein